MQSVNFSYAANGIKLRKQTKIDHQLSATWDYSGRFIYADNNGDNTQLAYLMANHGSLVMHENGSSTYEYSLKDHLGNTRITFDEDMNILQEDAYYPFGMNISGLSYSNTSPENKYKYNGKRCTERSRSELQDEFGLEWYDYGARMYDAELGRWHVPDPLAEKYYSLTPYHYTYNNPMRFIDINGEDGWDVALGCLTVAAGVVQWGFGVSAASTVVGGPAGVYLIMSGSATILLGTAQIIDGIANDGENNVPGGLGELTTATAEKVFDMEGSGLREAGAVLDLGTGIAAGGFPAATIEGAISGADMLVTASGPAKYIYNSVDDNELLGSISGKIQNTVNIISDIVDDIIQKTMDPVEELDPTGEALREHYRNGSLY